jgi:hypothetical protein
LQRCRFEDRDERSRTTMRFGAVLASIGSLCLGLPSRAADVVLQSAVIQSVELTTTRAYYVPTHPRVTTTIRFPREIGAPEGAVGVFTEDVSKQAGEYLVTWQQGDAYLTVTPLKDSQMANLNVPCGEQTIVVYFYPVSDASKAIACVNLTEPGVGSRQPIPPSGATSVIRQSTPPANNVLPATPARLLGLLDRLKLIHAASTTAELATLADAMKLEVACSPEGSDSSASRSAGFEAQSSSPALIGSGINDAGLYEIILLRAVRDPRLNCIGFVCLIRNTSDQVLAFDVNSFGARAGAEYLSQRISDAPPALKPGEQMPAYFVVMPSLNSPLRAANDWRISVDLVSPRTNPGAGITRKFNPDLRP